MAVSIAMKSDGTVWTWGGGSNGELGDNTADNKSSPVLVVGSHSFVSVSSANENGMGLKSDGTAWTWGAAAALGDDTYDNKSSPVLVVGGHLFVRINMGVSAAMGIKSNGEMWTWGLNFRGPLGDGTTTEKTSPVKVIGDHLFTDAYLAGTGGTTSALKTNGEVWAWGYGTEGQLGNNEAAHKSSPVLVVGSHSFIEVAYCCALKNNGEVWTWGLNSSGQLGNNTLDNKSSPVLVVGNHSFIKIAKGHGTTRAALKANGEVWTWGDGTNGKLGDNTVDNKSSPVLVVGNHSFIDIRGLSSYAFCALKANGEVWGWGANDSGLLGDSTIVSKSSPVLVVGNHNFTSFDRQRKAFRFQVEYRRKSSGGSWGEWQKCFPEY